jgi:hypothetical protein
VVELQGMGPEVPDGACLKIADKGVIDPARVVIATDDVAVVVLDPAVHRDWDLVRRQH